ncbi:uncharacterized protein I206_107328 [Kwoniella pini CBS 10737]|uniref:Zn(2)-C6 fungal-type domain-containing protein n=1 Tax=Kwoniella pini CBS 10737 TaxID=1296096 RepID=A0A1B9HYN2_9TREE|nr:uncharacterized protein I206_05128 [Kwoniella pini CBS 10737]OCF48351.1 hypothetical protein I206_05128 [Kwoniella pini CBS 10737]
MSVSQKEKAVDPVDIRWKMAVACDVCRRRKVRCDGERPCSRCKKGNRDCTFSLPRHIARKAQHHSSSKRSRSTSSPTQDIPSPKRPSLRHTSSSSHGRRDSPIHESPTKDHLLLIDPDDQIVYSGPSSGMPLFARLGLLRTVEVSESEQDSSQFASHSSSAFGITSAVSASRDYFDMCLQRCPQELMNSLIGHHLSTPVFFPLLHAPSFLSEFIAVTERRLKCTPQYGAMLMSILAVTARLVEGGRGLVPAAERAGETYYEFAQDLLRVSKNKLDIRHILALYHLALFAEGRNASAGVASSFVAEAIGLAFATGLHRSTDDFRMDPVTMQIRTRLFWSLYSLDIALAYSQGRPALIRLSECSIELPAVVDNGMITKTEILPQPEDNPPVIMAGAVKLIEIYIVLEQVLSAINAPFITISQRFNLSDPPRRRSEKLARAQICLDEIEQSLPPYLVRSSLPSDTSLNLIFLQSSRLRSTLLFVRTLIARQALIDEFEGSAGPSSDPIESTLAACHLSVDIVKTYSRLRHFGFLQYCSFTAVSHLTAASHTLIACMIRSSNLAFEHRPDLLSAIDMLILFSARFPCSKTVAQLLIELSRGLDLNSGDSSGASNEALAIRVLARKMAVSPAGELGPMNSDRAELPPASLRIQRSTPEQFDYEWLVRAATAGTPPAIFQNDSRLLPSLAEAVGDSGLNGLSKQGTPRSIPDLHLPWNSQGEELPPDWGDNFSFLNDGLFGSL